MTNVLLVGMGGFIGSVLRFWLSGLVQALTRRDDFPAGTLAVNIVGCLAIGLLAHWTEARNMLSLEKQAFVFVGLLGGFTTFSSFGNETLNLRRDGATWLALVNIASHLVFGVGAVWLGRAIGERIWQ